MISPPSLRLRTTPMTARFARTLFLVFVARHLMGLIAFGAVISVAARAPQSPWWLVLIFGLAYAAFAVFQGVKLFRTWRRRVAAEARATEEREESREREA